MHIFSKTDMNEVSIDLYHPSNNEIPRYTVHILDQKPNRENDRYAAFIVPQGRWVKFGYEFGSDRISVIN